MQFRDAGIQVSLDDFGTGYSAMSYLKKFDIDFLKIDKSFVRDLTTDTTDRAIAEAIIAMAHALDMKVIAEGVETEGQRAFLQGIGAQQPAALRGWFIADPFGDCCPTCVAKGEPKGRDPYFTEARLERYRTAAGSDDSARRRILDLLDDAEIATLLVEVAS